MMYTPHEGEPMDPEQEYGDTYDADEPDEPLAPEFEGLHVTTYEESVDAPEQTGPQDDFAVAPEPGPDQGQHVPFDDDENGQEDEDPDDVEPDGTAEHDVPRDDRPDEQQEADDVAGV